MMNFYLFLVLFINMMMFSILMMSSYQHGFHPLMLSLMLIFYSLFLVLKFNFELNNYWYSYILFLLMVGGVMILILYLTSISNNELFHLNLKYYLYFFLKLISLFLIMFLMKYLNKINLNMYEDIYILKNIFSDLMINIKELYINFYITIYMMFYLFLLMVICVLICLKNNTPLRQLLNYEMFI